MSKIFIFFGLLLLAEGYLIGRIMDIWGVPGTLLLLLLVAVVGGRLVKRQGVATLRTAAMKWRDGTAIGSDLVEGGLLLLAGFLFVFPGFLSDCLALLLLLPPIRGAVARFLLHAFQQGQRPFYTGSSFGPVDETIIEGEAMHQETTPAVLRTIPPPGRVRADKDETE
ncbi:MAG: FxsA family protein [Magnetococcus sp. MYC-9]